jgi:RNA polymerase-binding transcription factor DksA
MRAGQMPLILSDSCPSAVIGGAPQGNVALRPHEGGQLKEETIGRRLAAARDRLLALRESLATPGSDATGAAPEPGSSDQHPADVATETFERSKDLSILLAIDAGLADVQRAVDRLASGSYGICEACGQPIHPGRLEALPAARYCTADQARRERSIGVGSATGGYGYLAQAE